MDSGTDGCGDAGDEWGNVASVGSEGGETFSRFLPFFPYVPASKLPRRHLAAPPAPTNYCGEPAATKFSQFWDWALHH